MSQKRENKIDKVICRCAKRKCVLSYCTYPDIECVTFLPTINNEVLTKYYDPKGGIKKIPKLYTKQQAINLAYQTVKLCQNFDKTR